MSRLASLVVPLLLVAAAARPCSGGRDVVSEFYDVKRQSTTRAAYERAALQLRRVEVGMSEAVFLETMQLAILSRGGRPMDVRLDGYLALPSVAANRAAPRGLRHLVFGWIDGEREVAAVTVVLENRVVREIRWAEPPEPLLERAAQADQPLLEDVRPGGEG